MASGRLAEYHVPSSTIPNMHCQSALQLGPHGWRYTHAGIHKYFIHMPQQQNSHLTLIFINMLHEDKNTCGNSKTAQTLMQFVLISGFSKIQITNLRFTVYLCNTTDYRFHYSNPVTDPFLLVTYIMQLHLTSRALGIKTPLNGYETFNAVTFKTVL
jgi:hypothetical protein